MEITSTQFEKQRLSLLNRVRITREEILITDNGKPIAKIIPATEPELSCLDFMQEGIGCIENGPADLSTNPKHLENYGL
jgi:prevent-host-death family protein